MKPTTKCRLHGIVNYGNGVMQARVIILDDPTGKFFPRQFVLTSKIVNIDVEKQIIETLNTFYHYE